MTSEHRHDLTTNDLAKSLLTFQDYVKVYGGRVALGIAIGILLVVLIMQRSSRAKAQALKYQDDLTYCRTQIDHLRNAQADFDGRVSIHPAEVAQVPQML